MAVKEEPELLTPIYTTQSVRSRLTHPTAFANSLGVVRIVSFTVLLVIGWLDYIKHKLAQVMSEREATTILSGRVEVDDAYPEGQHPGGKAGRGSENKLPFVAAVETNDRGHPMRAVFAPVNSFSSSEITVWARKWLVPTATVVSDCFVCFRALTVAGCIHATQIVGTKRKSTDTDCFAWVNTLLSNIKTAIAGMYHGFKFEKYAHRYLSEAQYRFNRRFDLSTMLARLLYAGVRNGSRTERWLRLAEA